MKGNRIMHINEDLIEKFTLNPEEIYPDLAEDIKNHLSECQKCSSIYEQYRSFYLNIKSFDDLNIENIDLLITKNILSQDLRNEPILLLPENKGTNLIKSKNYKLVLKDNINYQIQKIVRIFKEKPIKAASLSFGILAILFYSSVSVVNSIFDYSSPDYALNDNGIIKVFNSKGEFIWKIKTHFTPNVEFDLLSKNNYDRAQYTKLTDIDDDGKKELLISATLYEIKNGAYKDTLYCFNDDGSLRWKTFPETEKFNYAPNWRRTKWIIEYFTKLDTKNGKKILLVANDFYYAGSVISLIDPITGQISSSTYIAGHTKSVFLKDIDDDGFSEVILGGFSTFNRPRATILKTDFFMGTSPDYYSMNNNLIKSNALYYLLLPITEYGEKLFSNGPRLVSNIEDYKQTGGISLLTLENNPAENKGGGLVFAFDKNFNCIYISTNTFYSENYNKFFDAGLVKEKLTFEKLQNFRNKILFWDGEKFVYEPTMNKYHNQKFIDAKGNEIKLNVNNIL